MDCHPVMKNLGKLVVIKINFSYFKSHDLKIRMTKELQFF